MENTYAKYAPNVYIAKCDSKHEKGNLFLLQLNTEKRMNVSYLIFGRKR